MRIAVIAGPHVPVPPVKYGGSELVISNLIKGLKELGHEPVLIAPGDSKIDCEIIPSVDKAIYFPEKKAQVEAFNKRIKAVDRKTHDILIKLLPRVDIIHSHGFDLLKFKDFPNLTTTHSRFVLEELAYYQKRKDLFYISISKNQQSAFPELTFVDAIYNGQDPDLFPVVTKPDDYLCFLGRFDRDKSPHWAIQLAIALGMKIKVAGKRDFDSDGYFEAKIAKYLSHPLVEYLGEIGFDEKIELLSKAKCNLHPTNFREPFGLTVIEAAYCGTPTLAMSRGSMPELIENGRTGILVEDFVEGFHKIHECYEMNREYIAKRARQSFTYKIMSKQYEAAYNNVLTKFKHPKTSEKKVPSRTKHAASASLI